MTEIPDYQFFMSPILEEIKDGREYKFTEVYARIFNKIGLTPDQLEEKLPSGKRVAINRVSWAKTYLAKGKLIEYVDRGIVKIAPRGVEALKVGLPINVNYLLQFAEFSEFNQKSNKKDKKLIEKEDLTPEEKIYDGYQALETLLAGELRNKLHAIPPTFFEHIVIDLLLAMGYGNNRANAGKVVGKSGDGGIDGIINQDPLGLDKVYIQAKRWEGSVGTSIINEFIGALHRKKADKGVLITTSTFTKDAYQCVQDVPMHIVLIDGTQLAQLMIEHNIGIETRREIRIKTINEDYFSETSL